MFLPNRRIAYKVMLPDGGSCYAADVRVFDTYDSMDDRRSLPSEIKQYILYTNTFWRGYSFFGTLPDEGSTDELFSVPFWRNAVEGFTNEPVYFKQVHRADVEGDDHAPGDWTEDALASQTTIQAVLSQLLTPDFAERDLAGKLQFGLRLLNG